MLRTLDFSGLENWDQFKKTFRSVANVLESQKNSYTCKLHLEEFYLNDP